MKVINFFSYRGGVGRTSLTIQIARLLAAMGKKVMVADLDFDAPGIPVAFGKNNRTDIGEGLINLFFKYKPASIYIEGMDDVKSVQDDIQSITANLKLNISLTGESNTGCVDILPCGRVDIDYWSKLSDPTWIGLYYENDESQEGKKRFKGSFLKSFFDSILIPALSSKPLNYDYLLLDSRSGITHYGAIGESISDREVVVFCPNDEVEQIRETTAEFDKMYPRDASKSMTRMYVLSRIPSEIAGSANDIYNKMKDLLGNSDLFLVHSDIDLHYNPRIRDIDDRYCEKPREKDKIKERADVVLIHEDYLKIFDKLCPEVFDEYLTVPYGLVKPEEIALYRAHSIWEHIFERKYKFAITNRKRLFELHGLTGEMKNPEDGKRNIAFKVVTFLNILNNFYETLLTKSNTKSDCIKMLNEALFGAGRQCGENFGQALASDWNIDQNEWDLGSGSENTPIIWEYILWWCKFDTEAGFGKIDCNKNKRLLRAYNVFVIDSEITQGRDYTAFFSGYILGVLSKIIGPHEVDRLEMGKIKVIGDREVPLTDAQYIPIYDSTKKDEGYPTDLVTTRNDRGIEYKVVIKSLP